MPLRCQHCRGKFGLVRRTRFTFSGYLHFCSKKCLNAYKGSAKQRFLAGHSGGSRYNAHVSFSAAKAKAQPTHTDQGLRPDRAALVRSAGARSALAVSLAL
jgi:hypothetical protein